MDCPIWLDTAEVDQTPIDFNTSSSCHGLMISTEFPKNGLILPQCCDLNFVLKI